MKALGRKLMKKNSSSSSSTRKKRNKLVNNIRGIVAYLRTDSYLYSHLITSSSLSYHHIHNSGFERKEGRLRHNNERELKEKLINYLKSDNYMYAPLEDVGHRHHVLVKNVISSPTAEELEFTRVTRTVISKKIALQTKRGVNDPTGDKQGDVLKGGFRDVGIMSLPTPEILQGKKQATPRFGDVDNLRMRNVMQELRFK